MITRLIHKTFLLPLTRFLKKIFGDQHLSRMGLNHVQNEVSNHFPEFGSYDVLETPYNDSLRQWKTREKKIVPKIRFFSILSSLVH